eukprot:6468851-Lingulodinium_polyedra.AAC.1
MQSNAMPCNARMRACVYVGHHDTRGHSTLATNRQVWDGREPNGRPNRPNQTGRYMASAWPVHGQPEPTESNWPVHGQRVASSWPAHGQFMASS